MTKMELNCLDEICTVGPANILYKTFFFFKVILTELVKLTEDKRNFLEKRSKRLQHFCTGRNVQMYVTDTFGENHGNASY